MENHLFEFLTWPEYVGQLPKFFKALIQKKIEDLIKNKFLNDFNWENFYN
jgi:hypothetical protein